MNTKKVIAGLAAAALFLGVPGLSSVSAVSAEKAPAKAPAKSKKLEVRKMDFRYRTDKNPLTYKCGEEMRFIFTLDLNQELETPIDFYIKWSRSGDDGQFRCGMDRIVSGKPFEIRTSLDRPGFVFVNAVLCTADGRTFSKLDSTGNYFIRFKFSGGAGADVDKILPAYDEPADFDAFWKAQRKRLDAVPVKAKMERLPDSILPEECRGNQYEIYHVTVDCAGPRPVTGRLVMKAGLKPKSTPAVVGFHGYGTGDFSKVSFTAQQLKGLEKVIWFDVNAHGYELGREPSYYAEMNKKLAGYAFHMDENGNRDTCYFNGMALRVMRAFDFIKTLPQWNGKDLTATGGSQGGLQTVWAASLVPGLSAATPSVTWCADIAGTSIGRLGGWRPEFRPGLAYYDAVFHSRRIPKTCYLNSPRYGLGDYVCPPSGVAAHFNAANCRKRAVWMQDCSHLYPPVKDIRQEFVIEKPAGSGITGTAPRPVKAELPKVDFVPAQFDARKWTLTRADGTEVGDFQFEGKRINFRKGRAADGKDLPVLSRVKLTGELVAEKDGYALVGAGFDWWWNFRINGKEVYGRTLSSGCNSTAAFERTDWIFRVPVEKGANSVEIEIVLGEHGFGNVGVLPASFASREISRNELARYSFTQKTFPEPDRGTEIGIKGGALFSWLFGGKVLTFRSAQPYVAGLEYREKGTKDWKTVWDKAMSRDHEVEPEVESGKTYEMRIVQNAYLDGWKIFRSEPVEMTF